MNEGGLWSASEWRKHHREDCTAAAALEQKLALMPAYALLLCEEVANY